MMKIFKKLAVSMSIFMLFFSMFGGSFVYVSASSMDYPVDKPTLQKMIRNKEISKDGLAYLINKRVDPSDLKYLLSLGKGGKLDIKRIMKMVNDIFGNGLNTSDINEMNTKGYLSSNVSLEKLGVKDLTPKIKPLYLKPGGINSAFLQKRGDIGQGAYQINFKNITAQGGGNNLKAGEVQATFATKHSFPKQLILPNGFRYEVNQTDVDGEFNKTQQLLKKVQQLKKDNIDVGKLEISEPKLEILPDRIQYVKTTQLAFSTEEQLQNIKTNLKKEFASEDIDSMLNHLKKFNVDDAKKTQGLVESAFTMQDDLANRFVNTSNATNYQFDPQKGLNYLNDPDVTGTTDLKNLGTWGDSNMKDMNAINTKAIQDCVAQVDAGIDLQGKTPEQAKAECQNITNQEKVLESKEVIGISLIPASTKDSVSLISMDPDQVRISANEIYQRYEDLGEVQRNYLGDNYEEYDANANVSQEYKDENWCKNQSQGDTDKQKRCKIEKEHFDNPQQLKKTQNLLNGFTIGESKSYSWGTKIRVNLLFTTITVLKLKFGFSYHYAFGVRIPIKVHATVSKDRINLSSGAQNAQNYTTTLQMDTFDGNAQEYRDLLQEVPGQKDSKVHNGKEFVFKFGASASIYIKIIALPKIDLKIPIISLALGAMIAGDMLSNGSGNPLDSVARTAEYFGVEKTTAPKFLADKLVDFVDSKLPESPEELKTFQETANIVYMIFDKAGGVLPKVTNITDDDVTAIKDVLTTIKDVSNLGGNSIASAKNEIAERLTNIADSLSSDNNTKLDKIATALQSAVMYGFIKNNEIDLSRHFKPPFGKEKIPLFTFKTPEIPLYIDGLFKIVTKFGLRSELQGRITLLCEAVNGIGVCPRGESTNTADSNSADINVGADNDRIHVSTKHPIKAVGKAIAGKSEDQQVDDFGRYHVYGVKYYDFRYHPILLMTLFTQLGMGANLPYLGWKTYWTPEIDLYTFKFSSDQLYLGSHKGTNSVVDMTYGMSGTQKVYNKGYVFKVPKMVKPRVVVETEMKDYGAVAYVSGNMGNDYKDEGGIPHAGVVMKKMKVKDETGRKFVYLKGDIKDNFGAQHGQGDGNTMYYTLGYDKNNQVKPSCGDVQDKDSIEYRQNAKIDLWPNLEKDLYVNKRTAYLNFIVCNKVYSKKIEFSKVVPMENHIHIPRFTHVKRKGADGGTAGRIYDTFTYTQSPNPMYTSLQEPTSGIGITSYTDKGYIKYAFRDEPLSCKDGEGKRYQSEAFYFMPNDLDPSNDNVRYPVNNGKLLGEYGRGKGKIGQFMLSSVDVFGFGVDLDDIPTIKAVKCIPYVDANGNKKIFQTLVNEKQIFTSWFDKDGNQKYFREKTSDLDGLKDKIDNLNEHLDGKHTIDELNPDKFTNDDLVNPGRDTFDDDVNPGGNDPFDNTIDNRLNDNVNNHLNDNINNQLNGNISNQLNGNLNNNLHNNLNNNLNNNHLNNNLNNMNRFNQNLQLNGRR